MFDHSCTQHANIAQIVRNLVSLFVILLPFPNNFTISNYQCTYTPTLVLTRHPVVFENAVDADVAVAGDVGVEYAGEEADLGRVEGVVERHLWVEIQK